MPPVPEGRLVDVRNCVDWVFPLGSRTRSQDGEVMEPTTPALAFGVHCSVVKELSEARVVLQSGTSAPRWSRLPRGHRAHEFRP